MKLINIKKSQVAVELAIIMGMLLFFMVIFFGIISENQGDEIRERLTLAVKQTALDIRDEIALASSSTDGYYRKFEIPEKIENFNYNVNLTEGFVYIRTTDGKNAMAYPVENTTGDLLKGINIIKKSNGTIYVNP